MFSCFFCEEEMKRMNGVRYGYVGDRYNCYRHPQVKPHLVLDASLVEQQLRSPIRSKRINNRKSI